jgi:hypothetical protein
MVHHMRGKMHEGRADMLLPGCTAARISDICNSLL